MQMIGSSPDAEIYEHNVLTTLTWSCDWSERGCDEGLPYRGAMARDEGVTLRAFSFISRLGRRTPVRLIVTTKRQIVVSKSHKPERDTPKRRDNIDKSRIRIH